CAQYSDEPHHTARTGEAHHRRPHDDGQRSIGLRPLSDDERASPARNVAKYLVSAADPQHAAAFSIRHDVEMAVGARPNVADALAEIAEKFFLPHRFSIFHVDAADMLSGERSDEHVAFPFRKDAAAID